MKILLLILSIYSIGSLSFLTDEKPVYYCDSQTAKRYHKSKDCKGLEECTHAIRETTVKEATKLGLTACKLEK